MYGDKQIKKLGRYTEKAGEAKCARIGLAFQ